MNNFFKKVIEGNGESTSEVCQLSFMQNFEDAVNVEWFNKGDYYEAIFYKNNLEYIALFNLSGILTEYRQNLPADYLPVAIKNIVNLKGEIMNSVLKNKGNKLEYEIIIRNDNQERYILIFSDTGNLIEENKL